MVAIINKNVEFAKLLIKKGARCDIKNIEGKTIFDIIGKNTSSYEDFIKFPDKKPEKPKEPEKQEKPKKVSKVKIKQEDKNNSVDLTLSKNTTYKVYTKDSMLPSLTISIDENNKVHVSLVNW